MLTNIGSSKRKIIFSGILFFIQFCMMIDCTFYIWRHHVFLCLFTQWKFYHISSYFTPQMMRRFRNLSVHLLSMLTNKAHIFLLSHLIGQAGIRMDKMCPSWMTWQNDKKLLHLPNFFLTIVSFRHLMTENNNLYLNHLAFCDQSHLNNSVNQSVERLFGCCLVIQWVFT